MEEFLLPCLFKSLFGVSCPGCGLQRSILLLFQGEVQASLQLYWGTIPILLLFLFTVLHLIYRYKWGSRFLIYFYTATAILIFCQYIYGLTNQH